MSEQRYILDLRGTTYLGKTHPLYMKELPLIKTDTPGVWELDEENIEVWYIDLLAKFYRTDEYFTVNEKTMPKDVTIRAERGATEMTVTVDQVIEAYVNTRAEIKELEQELADKIAPLKEFQVKREQWLANKMAEEGETSKKTPHGTAYFTTTESVTMGDWDAFWDYVMHTQQFNLLQHAVNKTAALEIMGEKRDQVPPPGVNYNAFRTVNVRKS